MAFFKFLSPVKTQKNPSTFKFSSRAKIITLWITVAIVSLFLFKFSKILPVFIWSAVTAYLFNPLISLLHKKTKVPKALWIVLLYIVLGITAFFVVQSFLPLISNEISDLVNGSLEDPTTFLGRIASQESIFIVGLDINLRDQVVLFSHWLKDQAPVQLFPIFIGAVEKLVYLLIFLVVTFYLILDADKYITLFKRVIPLPYRQEIFDLIENVNLTLGAYIRAQVVLIVIMSTASFIALSILQVKYALIISIATGFLEVIPIAGPILATTIAALVSLFQVTTPFGLPNVTLAAIIIAIYFILRQLEDYFIIPNVVSKFVKVHPVVAIFSLMVGGSIGGVLGLFLAIPTASIVIVIAEYIYRKLTEE